MTCDIEDDVKLRAEDVVLLGVGKGAEEVADKVMVIEVVLSFSKAHAQYGFWLRVCECCCAKVWFLSSP